ncbi:glutamine--fructose-6-phosphate transaminase (isomerizing) [Chloroflexota bacterium]
MCGILGYIGNKQAQPILLNCLQKLEYRGYDSCGIAIADSRLMVFKDEGRVEALAKLAPHLKGSRGIGHTRWATSGEPSRINAHPHCDCTGNIAVVHNGVINNCLKLRQKLTAEGHILISETDTELIPHLIEKYYTGNLEIAVKTALRDLEGSYAIIVLMTGTPELVAARKDSPLIIGIGDKENFIASDVPSILGYTNRIIYLEDGDTVAVTTDKIKVMREEAEITRHVHKILWNLEDTKKSGYEHFMLKEIHEQPRVIRDILNGYISAARAAVDSAMVLKPDLESILISACGSSYHAALVGKYIIEELLRIPVRAEPAPEFNCQSPIIAKSGAIAITQSGETADTLNTMKILKERGCPVLAITNVMGSTASRIADQTIYTRAGPEISVAATKSFTAQLIVLYLLSISHSKADSKRLANLLLGLRQLPKKIQQILNNEEEIIKYAKYLSRYEDVFLIGRGLNLPVAFEGALKLKEIAYIHAEGYTAGALKHGSFALLGRNTPVIAMVVQDSTHKAMLTNIKEIKARGAPLMVLAAENGDNEVEKIADTVIRVPQIDLLLSPVINTLAIQLLAYYTAVHRDCPIDYPRNLAKSVTVE